MKTTSKKKIVVSTLAIAMGAALAGSISGSVAWYQYSTKAAAQITGTSAGTIGELQIQGRKIGASTFNGGGVDNKVDLGADQFKPMSMYVDSSDDVHYVHAPIYQKEAGVEYDSSTETIPYVEYELQFKFEHRTGAATTQIERAVYLSYFEIAKARDASEDLSAAVRVELIDKDGNQLAFLSKNSGETVVTEGELDLNGNGELDTDYWDCTDVETTAAEAGDALAADEAGASGVTYYTREVSTAGEGYLNDGSYAYTKVNEIPATHDADLYYPLNEEGVDGGELIHYVNEATDGLSYTVDAHDDVVISSGYNPYDIEAISADAAKALVSTKTGTAWSDSLKVRVWLEGWALLGTPASASWSEDFINQNFNINMQFACSAVKQ